MTFATNIKGYSHQMWSQRAENLIPFMNAGWNMEHAGRFYGLNEDLACGTHGLLEQQTDY